MEKIYKIEKLEDMPKYVPIIFIKDNGIKNSKPRMVGLDIHDRIIIEPNGTQLYYYNLQCGESSHECSDFRFIKREATCYNDELYSRCCPMVDLEKLVADYTKQVRKEVLDELCNMLTDRAELIKTGDVAEFMFTTYDLQESIKQIQGETK